MLGRFIQLVYRKILESLTSLLRLGRQTWRYLQNYWHGSWWHKLLVIFAIAILATLGSMYTIAAWYKYTTRNQPLTMGVSFIPAYAESLGLNPENTMDALINDLGVRRFRLVSYWNQLEPQKGNYDFSLLDWQFAKAEEAKAKVTLSVGMRQPRWPECHVPDWAQNMPQQQWQPRLEAFITQVVNRYKASPALDSYQLENEFWLEDFGTCRNFSGDRFVAEFQLIHKLDTKHPVIISRSNNIPSWIVGQPRPDIVGVSVYRRVWDKQLTHRYFTYPLPAWYYGFLAGTQKLLTGHDSIIHELQMESWPPNGKFIAHVSLAEQNKSFSSKDFAERIQFGEATGMHTMDLWGAEYWYYRKIHLKDPSVWNAAQQAFRASNR